MKRNVSFEEISDGRLYGPEDMAKLGCDDCRGCSACCEAMGDSVILDPLDVYRLTEHFSCSFEQLLADKLELGVVDYVILPHLKMGEPSFRCGFLDDCGRCSIHSVRPGFCRLFPLGRIYDEAGAFQYFLQVHECKKQNRTKVKIKKWMGISDLKSYDSYIIQWHRLLKDLEKLLSTNPDEGFMKKISMFLLEVFYLTPYNNSEEEDFFTQFYKRLETVRKRCLQ